VSDPVDISPGPGIGIELRQVSKRYADSPGAPLAVDGISFKVRSGTLTTLLGPSGCGKTTTLRLIAGLESLSAGQIFIDGRDVSSLAPSERNVSMVFQSYALFPHLSVIGNVAYGLKVSGVGKAQARQRAQAAMATVGLNGFDARLPSELSGGQQQRVALARALVLEPAVLLFDEPLSNLDARLRRSMREEIRSLQQRLGLTVVYVTHDQSEALAVSDHIIVMNQGVIAQAGTPSDLYERPQTEFVAGFMGDAMVFDGHLHADGPSASSRATPDRRAKSSLRSVPRPGSCCPQAWANWPPRSPRRPTWAARTSTASRLNWV
jgi:iron(III) transport system ATP-binding protein